MIFLSAQPLTTYFLWQIKICTDNLLALGVAKENIHVLFATNPLQQLSDEDELLLQSLQQQIMVYFYEDERKEKVYLSSIRPHIIAKHFLQFPLLEKTIIFYHDADIIFREFPPLFNNLEKGDWYVSYTANYLDTNYIKEHIGEDGFLQMCSLVGVVPESIKAQDTNCGGAQYIMQNVSAAFWQKIEIDCEAIYVFLEKCNKENKIKYALANERIYLHGIQSWCADMWAILWNGVHFGNTIKAHKDLDFCWPYNTIESWEQNYILHNAGIDQKDAGNYFYKGNYVYSTPFYELHNYVLPDTCSAIYAKWVSETVTGKAKIDLQDVSFLIPVMIDSPDRLNNLCTVVRYLNKHFNTKILVHEYGETPSIEISALPIGVKLFFEYGDAAVFNHALTNKKLIEKSDTPFIAIYDTDVVFPVSQLMEAINLLRNKEADMVYPYDGRFANIDQLAAVLFSKFLTDSFLYSNVDKFPISIRRSFGGSVFLNKEKYAEAGGENLVFKSWGPEDIERYHRMKILGYSIKRVAGPLFHLHHQRNLNSGYVSDESQIVFMEEYINIFNMKKNELHAYVSQW